MTDAALPPSGPAPLSDAAMRRAAIERRLVRRHAAERRFQALGRTAIIVALGCLAMLLVRVGYQGHTAFWKYEIAVPVYVDPNLVDAHDLLGANYDLMIADQVLNRIGVQDDDLGERGVKMKDLLSPDLGFQVLEQVRHNPALIGKTLKLTAPVSGNADLYYKGSMSRRSAQGERRLDDEQLLWLDRLNAKGMVASRPNYELLTKSDSTQPELAGLLGAIVGSLLTLLVTAAIAVPSGVMTAVYLEEFAPKNRFTDWVEVNINNLAAVPSIVYGMLGLALFINWLGVARSSPLVGGLVLALMTLPTVIIATRSALKAVPPSIRDAALALGASRTQTVFQHVLPLAVPGVMTGAILGLAHALGETAPLLMIGMVSFVPGVPHGLTSAATVLPVQVFIWSNASERAFQPLTAAAILILLVFMILMNAVAVVLRSRFERRW